MPRKNINEELSKYRLLVKSLRPQKNKLTAAKKRYSKNLNRDKLLIKSNNITDKKRNLLQKKITKNKINLTNTNKELRKIYSKINYNNKKLNNLNEIKSNMFRKNIIVDLENLTYTINNETFNFDYEDRLILMKFIINDLGIDIRKVNIIMNDDNGVFFNNNYNFENQSINNIFNNMRDFRIDSDNTIFDRELREGLINIDITTLLDISTGRRITQYFLDGDKIHCFFNPILKYFANLNKNSNLSKSSRKVYKSIINKTKKYIKEYSNGIGEKDIENVCNDLKISVRLYKPFNKKDAFFQYNHKKPNKVFNYINTREHHLEVLHNDNKIIEINNLNEMNLIKDCLEENGDFYIYKRNRFGINKIITIDETYTLKLEHMDELIDFQDKIGIDRFKINYKENEKLSNYVFGSTLLTNSVNFKNNPTEYKDNVKHIDQYRSYLQFKECGYYKGFPTIFTDFVRLDKTKIENKKEFLNDKIGFFKIKHVNIMNCENNKRMILKKLMEKNYLNTNNGYSNVELIYLLDLGVDFKLISGLYCRKSFDISNEDLKLIDKKVSIDDENEIGLYAIFSGMLSSVKFKNNYYFRTSEAFASHLKCEENKFDVNYNNSNKTGIFSVVNENINHKAHIGSFIYSYQRINLFNQLFQFKYDNIVRVVMDGIFYTGETPKIINKFREKPAELMNDECFFINRLNCYNQDLEIELKDLQYYNKNDDGRLIGLIGAGGNGKSYNSITKNKNLNILYIAPSYTLARSKKEEFDYINEDVYANVLEGRKWKLKHRDYNIIIIDEITMITEKIKRRFIEMFGYSKIYFCGDLDEEVSYQLPPIKDEVMSLEDLDIIYEYKKNYRFKCDKLKKIIWFLRKRIKDGINSNIVLKQFTNMMEKENRVIDIEELKELYKIEDIILSSRKKCRKHENCNCSTNHIKLFNDLFDYEKYLITKNTDDLSNGDIVYNPEKIYKYMERRNSFTIHQIQGKTIKDNKVFIYSKNFFDITMLYVAVMRVVSLDRLYLIVD